MGGDARSVGDEMKKRDDYVDFVALADEFNVV